MKKFFITLIVSLCALQSIVVHFSTCFAANSMPDVTLGDDTEETDSSIVDPEILKDIYPEILEDIEIYLRSPRGSASRIATEEDLDSNSTNTNCIKPKNVIRVQAVYGKPKSSIVSQIPLNAFLMFSDLAK